MPSDHAAAVENGLPAGGGDLVVVAHSLGAFAGVLVAAHARPDLLVLLAPMIPAPGESAGEWWEATGHAAAIAALLDRHGPMSRWGPEAFADAFQHDVDPEAASEAERYDGAPGPGMFSEPLPLSAWPEVPTRVLAPREDRFLPLAFQRRLAAERLGLEPDEMEGGHLPMVSRPRELAARLTDLAP